MKEEHLYRSLEFVDEKYLESAENAMHGRKRVLARRWGTVAAALALVLTIAWTQILSPIFFPYVLPDYVDSPYSATIVASGFQPAPGHTLTGTKAYKNVYAPSLSYIAIDPLPSKKVGTLPVYYCLAGYSPYKVYKEVNADEYAAFVEACVPNLATLLGTTDYTVSATEQTYRTVFSADSYSATLTQSIYGNFVNLKGSIVTIDATHRDKKLIAELDELRVRLCEIFALNLQDTKIERYYFDDRRDPSISIYFYNEGDHIMNTITTPEYADYISLTFNGSENTQLQIKYSRSILQEEVTEVNIIPFKEAKKMCANGYVFGTGQLQDQAELDFSRYSAVGLEYRYIRSYGYMPFYVFYKRNLTAHSAFHKAYAKVYVPAVQIKGLEYCFD